MSDLTFAKKKLRYESDAKVIGLKSRFLCIDSNVYGESCDAEKNMKKIQTEPDVQQRERWISSAVTPTSTALHFDKQVPVRPLFVTPTSSSTNTLRNRSIVLHSDEQARSRYDKSSLYTPQTGYSPKRFAGRLGSAIKSKNATMMIQPAKRIPLRHQTKERMETPRASARRSSLRAGKSSSSRKSFIPERQHYYTNSLSKKENEIIPVTPSPRNNQNQSFSFGDHSTCSMSKHDRFQSTPKSALVHGKSGQKKMHLTRGAIRVKCSAQKMKKETKAGINGSINTPSRELPRPTSGRRKEREAGADAVINTPSRQLLRLTSTMKKQTRLGIDGTTNTPSRQLLRPTKAFSGKVVKREVATATTDAMVVTMEEAVAWMDSDKRNRSKNGRHGLIQKVLIKQHESKRALEIRDAIIPTILVNTANEPMAKASVTQGNSSLNKPGHILSLQNDFDEEATGINQHSNDYTQPMLVQGEHVKFDQSTASFDIDIENDSILRDSMKMLCLECGVNTSTDTLESIDSITGQFETRLQSNASEVSAKLEREQMRAECCDDPVASILMTDTTPGEIQVSRKLDEKGKLQYRNDFTFSGSLSAFSPCK
uniref:Uncharacterized protein n=1 Tax=Chaetoceros debilis TaxID=122233 RepID=A0A7S3QJ68_9STRA